MVEHETEMKLATSLLLLSVIEKILYPKEKDEVRKMPFRLQYRLIRTYEQLKGDYDKYQSACLYLMANYGHPSEDGKNVELDEIGKANYNRSIENILKGTVSHRIFTCEPDDLDEITDVIDISNDAMRTFVRVMTNDPQLEKELEQDIDIIENGDIAK